MRSSLWLVLLLVLVSLPIHPSKTHAIGAEPLKFSKNKVDYEVVSFDQLFFHYQPPIDIEHPDGNVTKGSKKAMEIPKEIKALNGKKVAVKGFIIPLANSGKSINEFLFADELVTCMFCAMLGYDQWMMGSTVDTRGFNISDDQYEDPVTIYGTLEVGPIFENGQFTCLYRIKADGVEAPRKKIFGIL